MYVIVMVVIVILIVMSYWRSWNLDQLSYMSGKCLEWMGDQLIFIRWYGSYYSTLAQELEYYPILSEQLWKNCFFNKNRGILLAKEFK